MMKNYSELISVVIPFYKADDTIEDSLDSIIYQTILPAEIVIVIDGCNDQVLKKICSKNKYDCIDIKILKLEKNYGPSHARNFGVINSKCEFIAFLDSDDCWHNKKIETQLKIMLDFNLNFSCHKYSFMGGNENISSSPIRRIKKYNMIFKTYIYTPTVMVKRSKFIGFPEDLKYSEDYYCWISNISNDFYLIDSYLAYGHKKPIGVSGLSANIYAMHKGFITANMILFRDNKINLLFLILSLVFEYLKFPFRYIR